MPHIAICGGSTCGKSTLGKVLAQQFLRKNHAVYVLAARSEKWPCSKLCLSMDELWSWVSAQRKANRKRIEQGQKPIKIAVFIDDAGQTIDKYDKRFNYFATDARHDYIRSIFLIHAGPQILPVVRNCVETLYLFRCATSVAKLWYDQFVHRELLEVSESLDKYQYLWVPKFGKPEPRMLDLGI